MAKNPAVLKIKADFSYVSARDGKTYTLTGKEKLFCEKYLELYGNGTRAMMFAYDIKSPMTAAAMAWEYLRKPNVMEYVDSLLKDYGFNDDNVEKQHLFLLNQHGDLKTKAKAVDMFYQLRNKYAPVKSINLNLNKDITSDVNIEEVAKKVAEELKSKKLDVQQGTTSGA